MNQDVIQIEENIDLLKLKLNEFTQIAAQTEAELALNQSLPEEVYHYFYRKGTAIVHLLHDILGDESPISAVEKKAIATQAHQKMLPFILQTETTARFFTKPLGYAGDYWVLEKIYENVALGNTPLGIVVDRMHQEASTSIAVRNRRALIANELYEHFNNFSQQIDTPSVKMLCIASGPAREIFDLYEKLENEGRLKNIQTTLLDFDGEALEFCQKWRDERGWSEQIETVQETILNLITGRSRLSFAPQDVVYSIGLIDYFQEKHVVKLLNYIFSILKPGGKVILGNFHKSNPFKEYMDTIVEWRLIHRDENDMNRIMQQSKFGKSGRIFFENEGINLFIECEK